MNPDDKWIVYQCLRRSGGSVVWVVARDTENVHRFAARMGLTPPKATGLRIPASLDDAARMGVDYVIT